MFATRSRRSPLVILLACFLLTVTKGYGQLEFPQGWDGDSTLRDVHFVDLDVGWAVGDRGAIIRTEDGGRSWVSFTTPRDMRWNDVFFLNEQVGWIAGGFYRGGLQRSVGVVIETRDGGNTWKNVSRSGIAQVKRIKFFDDLNGWMLCDSNQLFPTGMVVTKDGGATWMTAPKMSDSPIVIADAANPGVIFGVDQRKQFVNSMRPNDATQQVAFVNDVQVERTGFSVRAGDRGGVEVSLDLANWIRCKLPSGLDEFDWNSISIFEQNIWLIGNPGCLVAHSADHGKSWQTYRIPESSPLQSIFFLNKDRGWAVGDLGKVLSTKDGGKTWVPQRNAGKRLAMLNIATSESKAAIDTICLLSGSFGNISGVELLTASDRWEKSSFVFEQAMNRVGGSTVGRMSLGQGSDIQRQLVRAIRHRKPSVVVLDSADGELMKLVSSAVDLAEKEIAFPQHAEWGLNSWKVEKVISVGDPLRTDHVIAIDQFSATLGRPVSQQSQYARMLFSKFSKVRPTHDKLGWNLVTTSLAENVAEKGLTTGTRCKYDPSCNRSRKKLEIDNLQTLQAISKQKQNIERLLQFNVNSPLDEKSWLESITAATSGMDEISLGLFLRELAFEYVMVGKPDMSDMTERKIVQRIPQSEIADESLLKLIHRYSSYESIQLLKNVLRSKLAQQPETRIWDPKVMQAGFNDPALGDLNEGKSNLSNASIFKDSFSKPNSATGRDGGSNGRLGSVADRATLTAAKSQFEKDLTRQLTQSTIRNSVVLVEMFQTQFPAISITPEYEFRVARVKSLNGSPTAMDRLIDNMTSEPTGQDAWLHRIYRERQLLKLDQQESIHFTPCKATNDSKFVLDGFFNEEAWNANSAKQDKLKAEEVTSRKIDTNSSLKFAYDDEHLYIAIRQKRSNGAQLSIPDARTRDDDLTNFSRMEIRIDVDRDYASAYQFVVDERGCCNDSLWRDPHTNDQLFNPKWYIASTRSASHWTAEIAIPLNELVDTADENWKVGKGTAWIVDAVSKEAGASSGRVFKPDFRNEQLLLFR